MWPSHHSDCHVAGQSRVLAGRGRALPEAWKPCPWPAKPRRWPARSRGPPTQAGSPRAGTSRSSGGDRSAHCPHLCRVSWAGSPRSCPEPSAVVFPVMMEVRASASFQPFSGLLGCWGRTPGGRCGEGSVFRGPAGGHEGALSAGALGPAGGLPACPSRPFSAALIPSAALPARALQPRGSEGRPRSSAVLVLVSVNWSSPLRGKVRVVFSH